MVNIDNRSEKLCESAHSLFLSETSYSQQYETRHAMACVEYVMTTHLCRKMATTETTIITISDYQSHAGFDKLIPSHTIWHDEQDIKKENSYCPKTPAPSPTEAPRRPISRRASDGSNRVNLSSKRA